MDDGEEAGVGPGVPQDHPREEPVVPPRGAIPAPCPRRDVGVQVDPIAGPLDSPAVDVPEPRPGQDVGVQTVLAEAPAGPQAGAIPEPVPRQEMVFPGEPAPLPVVPSWEELERGLVEAHAMDLAARRRRTVAFEALERYCETRAVPHPSAAYWQGLVRAKREEDAHAAAWKAEKAERQARLRRQQEEAAEHARRQLERELEDARDRRREEEAALQEARVRWKEARRAEDRAAAGLGLVEERPQGPQPNPPGTGRMRYCCVCRWPGVRVPRRCHNVANHLPRPEAPPRG